MLSYTRPPNGNGHGAGHGAPPADPPAGPRGGDDDWGPPLPARRPPAAWAAAYRPPENRWPAPLWGADGPPGPPSALARGEEPVIDVGRVRELVTYPLRALRRRRRVAGLVFALIALAAAGVAAVAPRSYDVQSTIAAQRNFVMPALGNPRRSVPMDADAPTRLAAEAVLNRDNMVAIIAETGLDAAWPRMRTPLGRLRAAVREALGRPVDEERQRELLLNYLWSRLWVAADEQGIIRIGAGLPDPQKALEVVQVAQRRFLEARHQAELSLIRESIAIIETHASAARARIDSAMGDVRQFTPQARRGRALADPGALLAAAGGAAAPPADPALAALASAASAKRAALAAAEGARADRIGALRTRLAEMRNTLGPAHPDVVGTQQALAALTAEPPELAALREAARDADARLTAAGGTAARGGPSDASLASAALLRLATPAGDTIEDPRLTVAKSRLKVAMSDYEDLLDRLDGARIELETARAAFKYRYTVVTPPQYPRRLSSPNLPSLLVGGLGAAAALALCAALVVDLGSGRLYEGWQVSHFVGLRVLGETPPA